MGGKHMGGGFSSLLDTIDGGGAGTAGDTFQGAGPVSEFANALFKPRGYAARQSAPQPQQSGIAMQPTLATQRGVSLPPAPSGIQPLAPPAPVSSAPIGAMPPDELTRIAEYALNNYQPQEVAAMLTNEDALRWVTDQYAKASGR